MNEAQIRKDLNLNLLLSMSRLSDIGRPEALQGLGLDRRQIRRIRRLRPEQFQKVLFALAQVLEIKIEVTSESLDAALALADLDRRDREAVLELFQAGAPTRLMVDLYGLQRSDCAAIRRYFGCPGRKGRPESALSEAEERQVWHAWRCSGESHPARRILSVHRATGLSVGRIVNAIGPDWEAFQNV